MSSEFFSNTIVNAEPSLVFHLVHARRVIRKKKNDITKYTNKNYIPIHIIRPIFYT